VADPIPGDIVEVLDSYVPPTEQDAAILATSREWVVVHTVPGEPPPLDLPPLAGLRAPDDIESLLPAAVPFEYVHKVGHLDRLDGWDEDSPGIWSST
jgi:hypothetical protein